MAISSNQLLLAPFFIVGGFFRAIGAAMIRLPQWGRLACLSCPGNHAAGAVAGIEHLVNRICHRRRTDRGRRIADWPRLRDSHDILVERPQGC